jgi:hypothetical protein
MKKEINIIIGLVLVAAGAFLLLHGTGYLALSAMPKPLATIPGVEGQVGISVSGSRVNPLAVTKPGSYAEWKITVSNTGTANWDDSWLIIRVAKPGSQIITRSCSACPSGCTYCGWTGDCVRGYDTFLAEKCDSYCDYSGCKEDICSWDLQYKTDTTWVKETDSADCSTRIGSLDLGSIPAKTSKTVNIKLRIPSDATQSYTLLVGARAWISGTYIIDDKSDRIDIGGGNLVIEFVGILSLLSGLATAIIGIKK